MMKEIDNTHVVFNVTGRKVACTCGRINKNRKKIKNGSGHSDNCPVHIMFLTYLRMDMIGGKNGKVQKKERRQNRNNR